jgi:short-subunit dehydrogenase
MPYNVGVTVICPAFFATNLLTTGRYSQDSMRRVAQRAFEISRMTADHVAAEVVRAMQRKQLYVVLPRSARARWWFKRLLPTRFLKAVAKVMHGANERIKAEADASEREAEPAGHL